MALPKTNTYSEVTFEPFVEVYDKFKTIKYIKIALKGKILDAGGKTMKVDQFGEAYLQVFNEKWVPDDVKNYIDLVVDDFSGKMKIHYTKLRDMLHKVDFNHLRINGTVAYLHSIFVHKSMRGQGLGKLYTNLIIEMLKTRYQADYILLEAFPFELNALEEAKFNQEQIVLEKMYTKLGFTKLKAKGSAHYMYLKLNK